MTSYFLLVWRYFKEGEPRESPDQRAEVEKIIRFYSAVKAWNHVLENKIEHYSLYKAECVIDNS